MSSSIGVTFRMLKENRDVPKEFWKRGIFLRGVQVGVIEPVTVGAAGVVWRYEFTIPGYRPRYSRKYLLSLSDAQKLAHAFMTLIIRSPKVTS